ALPTLGCYEDPGLASRKLGVVWCHGDHADPGEHGRWRTAELLVLAGRPERAGPATSLPLERGPAPAGWSAGRSSAASAGVGSTDRPDANRALAGRDARQRSYSLAWDDDFVRGADLRDGAGGGNRALGRLAGTGRGAGHASPAGRHRA